MSNPMLTIEVQLFAAAVDAAGGRRLELSLPAGATLAEFRQVLVSRRAELGALADVSRWAVGTEFVSDDYVFTAPQCVAMIPPVSGG